MESKTLQYISYGLYIICSKKNEGRFNGQISNTLFQVTSNPPQIAISINKENLTHEYIDESNCFTASILSKNTPMKFIGLFGFKTGRDLDKLQNINYKLGKLGIPIILDNTVGYIESKVIDKTDLGTHTLFIGRIIDTGILREEEVLTYEYYSKIKHGYSPKNAPTHISGIVNNITPLFEK